MLQNTSRCSQPPLELCNVLSDSARAFTGCYKIWLLEYSNFGAAETTAQVCGRLGTIFSQQGSTTTRYFVYHIRLCYSHNILYIMIWHDVLSKSLYIYTCGDEGIMEMDSATWSIYLEVPGVDRHHLIIQNTHSIFPSSWSHALLPSIHRSTQFVWFIMARYLFLSSHPHPTHLEPEPPLSLGFPLHPIRGAVEWWSWAVCLLGAPFRHTVIERT